MNREAVHISWEGECRLRKDPVHGLLIPWQWVRRSYKAKLMISFFATSCVSLLLMGTIYYYKTSQDIERGAIANLDRLADQTVTILENHMDSIRNIAWSYFSDSDFQGYVEQMSGTQADKSNYYRNRLGETLRQNKMIGMIGVYDLTGNGIAAGDKNASNPDWIRRFREQKAQLLDMALRNDGTGQWRVTLSMAESTAGEKHTVSFVQSLKKISNYSQKQVGMIYIEMNEHLLKQTLADLNSVAGDAFVIADARGVVVAAQDDRSIGTDIGSEPWFRALMHPDDAAHRIASIGGEPYILLRREMSRNGWMLAGKVPLNSVLGAVQRARNFALGIGLASLAVATALVYFIASSVTKPIRRLREHMKQVELGNFHAAVPVRTYDEIGALGKSFNRMIHEINQLVEKVYEAEILKKEAEIVALQTQINPHFLYNALGTIDSLASIEGQEEICRISQALGSMFRYSISGGKIATLSEEIRQVELYLAVQQIRFSDRFHYRFEIEPGLEHQPLPKLVLQPIVENAIRHGLEKKREKGCVRIAASIAAPDRWVVRIADDGVGCAPDRVEEINRRLSHAGPDVRKHPDERASIGLDNVSRRLRLHYGSAASVRLSSRQGHGTVVELRLPLMLMAGGNRIESAGGG